MTGWRDGALCAVEVGQLGKALFALDEPPDLAAALSGTGTADTWEAFPRSIKRGTLEWIKTAKGADTRAKRIADVTGSAAQGLRPSPFRRG